MSVLSPAELNRHTVGFDRHYGLEWLEVGDEQVLAQVTVDERHRQPMGLVHGGVYASMAESMASVGTAAGVIGDGLISMGMSNATTFLKPITEGVIHGRAVRRHRGRTQWLWDVDFTDDAGRTCALVRMTIAVRPPRPPAT